MSQILKIKGYPGWVECPDQLHPELFRWLENDDGDIISVVKMNYKKPSRMGIDGEIRCSIGTDCFSIPCSLNIVAGKSSSEIIRIGKRMGERRGGAGAD